jgi:diguanylate cyclase (GGDEF)-like protein/PAS domain S-box-containing protein
MGAAIVGMHYTGMYATVCVATGNNAVAAGGDLNLLAAAVTAITLLIIGTALTVSLQSQSMMQALQSQNLLLKDEIARRREAETELQHHRDNLQALVDARTQDLSQANRELHASETRFRATFDHAAVGIAHFDLQNRHIRVNRRYCDIVGYEPEALLGKGLGFLNVTGEQNAGSERRAQLLSGAIDHHAQERRYRRKDGTVIWVMRTESLARDGNGTAQYYIRVIEDITWRKQSERMQAQLAAIVESSDDAIVSRAPDDTIVSWNAAAERMFGWRAAEVVGQPFRRLLSQTPDVPRQGRFEKVLRGEPAPSSYDDMRRRKDGSVIHVHTTMSAVRDEQGKILLVSCIMRDVTARVYAERQIERLATKDALTGLSNRSMLMAQMVSAIERAARAGTQLVVMFVDLDRFKEVNDTLGHAAGDDLLRECARRLTECVREVDVVARLGGDEFVVMLTDVAELAMVSTVADRMLKLLTTPYDLHGSDAQISASIGICFYPADGTDVAALMKNADIAMYHAKELGRNNYQFYAEEMNQRMMQRLQLVRELRSALENDEFVLHYQPQFYTATEEMCGVESLVRWQHPTRGLLLPAEFIPAAEEAGLIVALGEWILNHACLTLALWRKQGVRIPYVVVNVSAAQLGEELVATVRNALVTHDIEPGWLMLEITESMLMERVEEAITILHRIRSLGLRIAMDDFGTGYSSLSILQRLPLDTLKIDRSFVSAIDDEANNARAVAIIGAIIAIAKELNLSVVAEGVETTTQLAFLRTLNCDICQGHLYSLSVDTLSLQARYAEPLKSVLEDKDGRAITMTNKVTLELPIARQQVSSGGKG